MDLREQHADLAMHTNDVLDVLDACRRAICPKAKGLLEAFFGHSKPTQRPLTTPERHLLCERAVKRFERTFFGGADTHE